MMVLIYPICFTSKMAGYEPQVRFSACIVSDLHFKLYIKKKSIGYRFKIQYLVTSSVDGTTPKAIHEFNKALFHPLHKSHYNETDIQILKEC